MADVSEKKTRAGEQKPPASAEAARLPERPLDVDVRSSAGPYPRPRPRGGVKIIWLAVAAAALILGLTWVLFKSEEEPLPPSPIPPPPAVTQTEQTEPVSRPVEGVIDFAPTLDQPAESMELNEPSAEQPPPAPAPAKPAEKPAPAPAKPAEQPTPAPAKPAEQPAPAPAKPAEQPTPAPAKPAEQPAPAPADQATDQSTASPPPEKPAAGTGEISDKWVVNIYSTPDATESLRFLSNLLGQDVGGRVYASEAVLEGRLQHRIRVGFFDTREEAEAVGVKIQEQYNLYSTPWAVRPSREEENRFGNPR